VAEVRFGARLEEREAAPRVVPKMGLASLVEVAQSRVVRAPPHDRDATPVGCRNGCPQQTGAVVVGSWGAPTYVRTAPPKCAGA
jgi:hypothetical protein